MPCDLDTIQAAACASGIGKLTNSVPLLQVTAQLLCEIAESGGGGAPQTPWAQNIDAANFNITNLGTINGRKVYRALLTQVGTAAPVATVLENSLGGTVVWARTSAGIYTATLAGVFTANKTFLVTSNTYADINSFNLITLFRSSANVVTLNSQLSDLGVPSLTSEDDLLNGTPLEITVYP